MDQINAPGGNRSAEPENPEKKLPVGSPHVDRRLWLMGPRMALNFEGRGVASSQPVQGPCGWREGVGWPGGTAT